MASRSDAAEALPLDRPPPESCGLDIIWMSGPLSPPPPSCRLEAGRFDFAFVTAARAFATPLPQTKSLGASSCQARVTGGLVGRPQNTLIEQQPLTGLQTSTTSMKKLQKK